MRLTRLAARIVRALAELPHRAVFHTRYGRVERFVRDFDGVRTVFSCADPYSKHWFFPRYEHGRIHEEAVTKLLLERWRRSRCFVDVGAHLGWFTCIGAMQMADGAVFSFEMDALHYALLERNIALNELSNVVAVHAAVTDRSNSGSYLRRAPAPTLSLADPLTGAGERIEVRAVSLDSFFAQRGERPDLVKIDVEGAELLVLEGMNAIVHGERPELVIELHPDRLRQLDHSPEEVIAWLRQRGYRVFLVPEHRAHGVRAELEEMDRPGPILDNAVAFATTADVGRDRAGHCP